jgi:hypothetical protein
MGGNPMEQKELSEGRLLNKEGNLNEAGYSFRLIKDYHREDIKASGWRIKEWDYYYIGNNDYAIALTIDDNSYMDLCSVTLFDYKKKGYVEKSYMHPFSFGKRHLPETSKKGDTIYQDKNVDLHFANNGQQRHLYGTFKNLTEGKDVKLDIILEETCYDSMVIATPFKKKRHFYYNQKINNLKASGYYQYDHVRYPVENCYGVLDWGRGVWTRKNTWYWASLNARQDNHTIGFNLGYGFGDTSAASENMFFFDNRAYKLNDVTFHIQKDGKKDLYEQEWTFTSQKDDIHLTFTPLIVRKGGANVLIINSRQRQVFGYYDGYIVVNGHKFEIKHLLGFAEKVYNRW